MTTEVEEYVDPLLKVKGVTPELLSAFKDAGYYTVESLAVEAPHVLFERIGERAGLTLEKAREITREARKHIKIEILTLAELLEEEKKRRTISTGSKELDKILGGGIHTSEVTGVSGPYGVGKTELIFTAAINTVQTLKAGAWILDTEGTTGSARLVELAMSKGLTPEEFMDKIHYSRIYGTEDLIATIEEAHKKIRERQIKFIGVDTLVNPFRAEYPGRELLAPRQQKINRSLRRLLDYARAYDMAVLVTNQVLASPIAYMHETRPEVLAPPTGGYVFCYAVNNHLYMRHAQKGVYVATLIDSSYMPRAECRYIITNKGIEDVAEAS